MDTEPKEEKEQVTEAFAQILEFFHRLSESQKDIPYEIGVILERSFLELFRD